MTPPTPATLPESTGRRHRVWKKNQPLGVYIYNETSSRDAHHTHFRVPLPRKAWLLDPARVVIFLLSLLLITYASQQAVKLDREPPDDRKTEGMCVCDEGITSLLHH